MDFFFYMHIFAISSHANKKGAKIMRVFISLVIILFLMSGTVEAFSGQTVQRGAFGVKEGDKMFIPESERVKIW